jgi:hypothetical protein
MRLHDDTMLRRGPTARALTDAGYPVAASTLATMFAAGGWRSDLALCKARIAMLTKRERDFIGSITGRANAEAASLAAGIADQQRTRLRQMMDVSPPPPVDLLAQELEHARRHLDRALPIAQRARVFWAAAVHARHLGSADVVRSDLLALARDVGLASDLPGGAETVDHLIRSGIAGLNPFSRMET